MKLNRTRQGWLILMILGWFFAASVSADDNSTVPESVPETGKLGASAKPLPESAASQKMYGIKPDSSPVVEPKPESFLEVMLRILGALLIVIAIILGGTWWFRKSRMFGLVPAQSSHLNVIETRLLGSRHALHVVEYGSKRFLIADSPAGTNYLTDLEKLNDSPQEINEAAEKFSPGSFAGKLKSLLERKR
jgi:flagellar biogenesis protein FliO